MMETTRKRKFDCSNVAVVSLSGDDTQLVDESQFDVDLAPRKTYGRLVGMNRGVSTIDLHEESFICGRGGIGFPVNYSFTGLIKDNTIYKYISKKQFFITRDYKSEKTTLTDTSRNGTLVNQEMVGLNKTVELVTGDVISIGTPKMIVFVYQDVLSETFPEELSKKYIMTNHSLGKGGYGKVLLAYTKTEHRCMVAVKVLNTLDFQSRCSRALAKTKDINNEVEVMLHVNHANCIRIFDWINVSGRSFLVLEYVSGGEFFERIVDPKYERQGLGDTLGKYYSYQLLSAIAYLHGRQITHRDIKPENILCASAAEYTIVKLSDFGMAKAKNAMKTHCGTPSYIAPEVNDKERNEYTPKVDVWSLGCVLFTAFVGYPAFSEDYNDMTMAEQVRTGRLIFHAQWRRISAETKKAITQMLTVDVAKRPSASALLNSSWMQGPEAERAKRDVAAHVGVLMKRSKLE